MKGTLMTAIALLFALSLTTLNAHAEASTAAITDQTASLKAWGITPSWQPRAELDTDANPYWCTGAEGEVSYLIGMLDQAGRTAEANTWRAQLAGVYEFHLDFCEDVYIERYDLAYELYLTAGRTRDAQRLALRQAQLLASEYRYGGEWTQIESGEQQVIDEYTGRSYWEPCHSYRQSPLPFEDRWDYDLQMPVFEAITTWYQRAGYTEAQLAGVRAELSLAQAEFLVSCANQEDSCPANMWIEAPTHENSCGTESYPNYWDQEVIDQATDSVCQDLESEVCAHWVMRVYMAQQAWHWQTVGQYEMCGPQGCATLPSGKIVKPDSPELTRQ